MHGEDPSDRKDRGQRYVRAELSFCWNLFQYSSYQGGIAFNMTSIQFEIIGKVWFLFLISMRCFTCFPNRPQNKFACVLCFITLCKKVVAWDKRSPWAGWLRGKALAYTGPLLTQCRVFTMWLMDKDGKSLTEAQDVMQCDLKFPQLWPNCKFSRVCEAAKNPCKLTPSGGLTFYMFQLYYSLTKGSSWKQSSWLTSSESNSSIFSSKFHFQVTVHINGKSYTNSCTLGLHGKK